MCDCDYGLDTRVRIEGQQHLVLHTVLFWEWGFLYCDKHCEYQLVHCHLISATVSLFVCFHLISATVSLFVFT